MAVASNMNSGYMANDNDGSGSMTSISCLTSFTRQCCRTCVSAPDQVMLPLSLSLVYYP